MGQEVVHWLLFFFVVGGLAILFLTRANQTAQLITSGTNAINSLATTMKTYAS